jgi:hypothetical protein
MTYFQSTKELCALEVQGVVFSPKLPGKFLVKIPQIGQ